MASWSILQSYLEKNFKDFETFFKDFIAENVVIEELDDIIVQSIKKVVNSVKYWSSRMQKVNHKDMILFTTLAIPPANKVSFLSIFKALSGIFDLARIKQVYIPENRNFLGIEFNSQEDCEFVKRNFKMVEEAYIIHTSWINEAKVYQGRIHWLPMYSDKTKVSAFLNNYFAIKELNNAKLLLYDNVFKESNVFEFKALLKTNYNIEEIPHLVNTDGQNALVTIKGRRPLCTNCKTIGHIRKDCKYIYCQNCKLEVLKGHDCNSFNETLSYAEIMKITYNSTNNSSADNESKAKDTSTGFENKNDTSTWMVVNKSNQKSYSKKVFVYNAQNDISEHTMASNSVTTAGKDEKEEIVLNQVKTENLFMDTESIVLKRKLDSDSSDDQKNVKVFPGKNDEVLDSMSSLVDKNPYDILSTDDSEMY